MARCFNKVFCVGLSRTGTTSLCTALESFGLKAAHWPIHLFTQSEVLGLPPFSPRIGLGPYSSWRRGKELKASQVSHNIHQILNSHDAFGDLPIPLFYRNLDKMYPNSIFIHTTRNVDSWIKSMKWLFDEGAVLWGRGHIDNELLYRVYGTTRFDPHILRSAFYQHEADVADFMKSRRDRSLVLQVDEGEMTYDILAKTLRIQTEYHGCVPSLNESRKIGVRRRVSRHIESVLFPLHRASRLLYSLATATPTDRSKS